ncbi:MAG: HgcAB-like fusion protein [Candidatus Baldrarchaeia archaeon]
MSNLRYLVANVLCTLLRFIPIPCRTGVIKIGNPGRDSPVLLTCNYWLTVERVKKAIRGIDCYLLVANSRGINVWCASAGGHLTNHSVISILKTSGIEELVGHRNIILPQLAASGIEAKVIKEKTGWNVIWGPVYAHDIPEFLRNNLKKTPNMREIKFPLRQRLEISVAWAFPISLIIGLILFFVFPKLMIPALVAIWSLSFLTFLAFPLFSRMADRRRKRTPNGQPRFLDTLIYSLFVWGIFILLVSIVEFLTGQLSWIEILRWAAISVILTFVLNMDLMGLTPIYRSEFLKDRLLTIEINQEKCIGCRTCENVCPRNCYRMDEEKNVAVMVEAERCIKCGACIVQCPSDALYFRRPDGEIVPPEVIRKFKLNFIGTRAVRVE